MHRSSLRSELSDLARRPETSHTDDVSLRSEAASVKIRDLRQQVLKLQRKSSDHVKEVVMKDKLITQLQTQITHLNNEKDELKNENNANLSVIQRLKDNLHDARGRLSALEEDQDCSNYTGKMSSTASLPEITATLLPASSLLTGLTTQYTSKFARSLTRQSQSNSLVQQLSDQLDLARLEKRQVDQEMQELITQLEICNTEKLSLENQLVLVKTELQELRREHDNLKDDFRTLVRKYDGEKENRKSADDTSLTLSRTKMMHDAQKGQILQETEEKLEAAILQLQLRETEMENIAQHYDNVHLEIVNRDRELGNLRAEVSRLQDTLSESQAENQVLTETVNHQRIAIQSLQSAVESDRRRSEARHKTVRLIYKDGSDLSEDEAVIEKQRFTNNNNNNTPKSFLMSSSDSFEI